MEDDEKPREQLTSELRSLRQEVSELKSLAAGYRQAEKRLHRQHDRLEARLRINQAILQTQDLNEQLNLILDEVLALLKVESGSIHLVQGQNVELRCWRGISNQLVHHLSSLPVDSPVDCLQKRQVIHKRLSEQGVAHRLVKAEGIQAWASFPLFLPGPDKARSSQWLGTILVGSRRYRALSRADIQAFEAILDPLARLINHARDDHEAEMRLYRLFILREIDRAISTRRLISDILGVVVERVPRELGAEAVAISLPDEPERGLRFSRMRLPNGMVIPTEGCTLAKRLQRQFNEQQTPIIIADLAQNPDVQIDAQQTAPYKFVSYLGVPLVARGQTIGLLHVLTTRPRVFWEEDINFFSTLAGQVASAIDNTRLLNQAGEAEQRYRSIFDNAVNGIYQSTPSGQFMAINPALARMLAYESPEALITNLTDIKRQFYVNPKRRAEFVQLITEQGVVRGFEAQVYRRDGSLVWISENARAVRDAEGTLLYYEGFVEDITERKQLEERLEAIYQLGRELTLLHDETAIIRRMLETAANLLRVDITGYGRMEAETGELEYRFRLINGVMEPISLRLALDSEQGPAVTAARTGQTFNVPDLSREPAYVPLAGRSINRSELCVPMKVNQRVIGVLQAESAEPAHFTSADQQLLQNLADQAAAALENARLYTETQRRTRELAALNRASRVMASSLDLNIVLEQMLAEVKSLLEAEGASALLLDTPTSEELVFAAAASPGAEIMIGLRVPLTTSIAGWVARNGQPVLIDDTQHDRRFYAQVDAVTGMTTRSLLAVPLIRKETVIGVVEVINKAKGNFNRYDLDMLEALSGSAAIAIENARLYQAERARYQEAEALRRAALTLTSTIALDQVFAHILTELRHVAPYDSASVQLLKGDRLEIIDGYGFPDLSKVLGITLPATGNIANARVIETREPIIIDDVQESQLVFDIKPDTSAKIRNWMGVPLIIGERVIGMLTLDKYQANFYTPDHARIARAYAAQAAIALENARLHTEMEERAKQLAVLHELDRAITASLNIDDIYYAFAHHTARLVSYDCMSITLIKEDELQVAQAVDHRIDKNKEFEERWLTAGAVLPKKDSAAGWVIRQGQPLLRNSIPPNMRDRKSVV